MTFPAPDQGGRVKLTQAKIQGLVLERGKTDQIHFDDDIPGFGLRLRAKGARTWIVQYALGTKQRRMTLGSTKVLDPTKARQLARDLLAKVRLGHDPAGVTSTGAHARI